ncbi:hypothetical protein WR25_15332 [Diploscapter pachys]|uniref:Uncharacterized protein n=1 Tax=Diploscapter pachys TaxID=2018661 RepID=A0A2A2KLG7_9BILA|nr:hypothetical protein WR25_15332 [Diploscapter pachys]
MNFAMVALFGLCQLTFASPPGSAMASKTAPKTVALDPPGIDVPSEQIDDPSSPSAMGPPPPVLEGSMTATDGPIPPPPVDTYTTTLSPMTPIATNFGDSSQFGQSSPSILDGSSLPSYQPKPVSSYGPPPTGSGSESYGSSGVGFNSGSGMGGGFQSSNLGYGQHNSYSSHSSSYSSGMGGNYGSQPFYGMGQQQPSYGGYQNFHGDPQLPVLVFPTGSSPPGIPVGPIGFGGCFGSAITAPKTESSEESIDSVQNIGTNILHPISSETRTGSKAKPWVWTKTESRSELSSMSMKSIWAKSSSEMSVSMMMMMPHWSAIIIII